MCEPIQSNTSGYPYKETLHMTGLSQCMHSYLIVLSSYSLALTSSGLSLTPAATLSLALVALWIITEDAQDLLMEYCKINKAPVKGLFAVFIMSCPIILY